MKKLFTLLLILICSQVLCGYKIQESINGIYTQQPREMELIDKSISQVQYALTLRFASSINLNSLKVGENIVFFLPSDVKLQGGAILPAGTKFQARIIQKKTKKNPFSQRIKFIINEIIFTDAENFIILSNPHHLKPLNTISADRILGKNAKISGTYRLGTVITEIQVPSKSIKFKPDTTTAVGICILAKTNKFNAKIKVGTPITLIFENNLKPERIYVRQQWTT